MNTNGAGPLTDGRISYLFITVHHFEEMLTFYRDRLGFRVSYMEDGLCAFLHLHDRNGPYIALYSGRKMNVEHANHWFIAIDVQSIEAAVAQLRERDVQVGEIEQVPYGRAAKLLDPEGNVIEIHEPAEQ